MHRQYSTGMQHKLKSDANFKGINDTIDSIKVLINIKRICYNYQPHEYPPLGAWDILDKVGKLKQQDKMKKSEQFESVKTVVKVCNGNSVDPPPLLWPY